MGYLSIVKALGLETRFTMNNRRVRLLALIVCLFLSQYGNTLIVDIPDGTPLPAALNMLARTANVQLLYVPKQIENRKVPTLKGELTLESALEQLLSPSELEFLIRGNMVVVKPQRKASRAKKAKPESETATYSRPLLEEVLVTARKRIEFSQSVPITLNVLSETKLNTLGIQNPDDIEKHFANLTTNDRSIVSTGFAIRGVGTNNIHVSAQQSVGLNIDDVAAVSPFVSVIGLFDLDRLEVLRGPQNTLYGRNTIGGVVNYHTKTANVLDGTNGKLKLNAGNGGLTELEAAAGFPITETLAGRVALMQRSFEGLWTNLVDNQDYGAKESKGGRFNLAWNPNDTTSLQLTLATASGNGDNSIRRQVGNLSSDGFSPCPAFNQGESAWVGGVNDCWSLINSAMIADNHYLSNQLALGNTGLLIENPNHVSRGGTDGQYDYLVNYSSKWGETYQHESGGYATDYDNLRAKLEHDFRGVKLTLISALDTFYLKSVNSNDLSGFESINEGDWDVHQQELRLTSLGTARFSWLAGVYHSYSRSFEDTWAIRSELAQSPAMIIDSKYEGWSVYGEFDYDFNDDVAISLGARYTNDQLLGSARKTVCTQTNGVNFGLDRGEQFDRNFRDRNDCLALPLLDESPKQALSEIGWKIGLNWHASSQALVYSSISKGFKGGAYDNRALANGDQPIGPEFLLAYELGLKSVWFNDLLQLNAAIYRYNWRDIQVFAIAPDSNPYLLNIPQTNLKGLEVDIKWAPSETLFAQLAFALSDNRIVKLTDFQRDITQWETGYEISNAPHLTASVLIENHLPLGNGELELQARYRYMSEYFYFTADPSQERAQSDAHQWLSARISYRFGSQKKHAVAIWGENLNGEKSIAAVNSALPGNINFPAQIQDTGIPTWGVSIESQF